MTSLFQARRLRSARGFSLFLCTLAILLTGATAASAQEIYGTIRGSVIDPSGAPIAKVAVLATDVDRHTTLHGTTDKNGDFHLTGVPAGRYQVSAAVEGYATSNTAVFPVGSHQSVRINYQMRTLGNTSTASLVAPPSLLQTESGELRTTIPGDALAELPTRAMQ
jgi:hypothetical protein